MGAGRAGLVAGLLLLVRKVLLLEGGLELGEELGEVPGGRFQGEDGIQDEDGKMGSPLLLVAVVAGLRARGRALRELQVLR